MSYAIYVLLGVAYLLSNILRTSAAVVFPGLVLRLGIGAALAGFLSSLFFYVYGLAQPLTGPMHNRYGPIRVIGWGMVLTALGLAMLSAVNSAFLLACSRLISGIGTAPLFSGLMIYTTVAFSSKRQPLLMGLNMCWAYIGTILSGSPLGYALDGFGHTAVFGFLTALTFATGIILLLLRRTDPVPDAYAHLPHMPLLGKAFWGEIKRGLLIIWRNRSVRSLVLVWALANAAILSMQGLWGVSWITSVLGTPESTARRWTMFLSIGMAVAAPFGGKLFSAIQRRPGLLKWLYLFTTLSWATLCLFMALKIPYVYIPAFLVGNGTALSVIYSNGLLPHRIDRASYGLVLGLANMLVFLISTVYQSISGVLIDLLPTPYWGYLTTYILITFTVGLGGLTWRSIVYPENPKKRSIIG